MIFNEVFDRCYHQLAGTGRQVQDAYNRKRYNRALLALRCQNYFLGCTFTNTTGAAGITGVDRTTALERNLIIRGGGMNAIYIGGSGNYFDVYDGGAVNLKVTRSGSSRAQVSKESIRSSHYFSNGEAQQNALDWPIPWVLDPNEIIQVDFTQVSAVTANTIFGVGFYGVTVDRNLRCDAALPESILDQIAANPIQKPRYIHLKTDDGGGTIVLPAIGTDERVVANTIEVAEHMLVLGWRRWMVGMNTHIGAAPSTTIRLVVTGGSAFSRIEIPVKAFEYYARPDEGYFKFAVPHFIPQGSSISLSITSTIESDLQQFLGEIELICVTV
jgi:hypothetical protein